MKLFMIFFLLIYTSLAGASKLDGYYIQNGCEVRRLSGDKIFSGPGLFCIFLDDGSIVSASPGSLRLIKPDQTVAWNLDVPVHHQINLSEDKKSILVLSSSFLKVRGVPVRDDRFIRVGLNGVIEADASIGSLVAEGKLIRFPCKNDVPGYDEYLTERSHFNSIFEIPDVPPRADAPWLKRGNIIVNSLEIGVLVLTPDMTKVLHSFVYADSWNHRVHDVKVLPSGKILLFNNQQVLKVETDFSNSSIVELDPVTLQPTFAYGRDKDPYFFAVVRSGAHEIGSDLLVFSLEWQGVYVLDKKARKIIFANHSVNHGPSGISSNQEVRLVKLEKFFSHLKKSD